MNNRWSCAAVVAVFVLCGHGCNSHRDVAWRYRLEREAWKAGMLERGIGSTLIEVSQREIELAISAYENLLKENPLAELSDRGWDPTVMRDIRSMIINSKISLASLYFLGDRVFFAGELLQEDEDSPFIKRFQDLPRFDRRLYVIGRDDKLEFQCENIFENLVNEEQIWIGDVNLKGEFLDIPLELARIYKRYGYAGKCQKYCGMAGDLYSKIIAHQPDSPMAKQARIKRLRLRLIKEDWQRALVDVDDLLKAEAGGEKAPELELYKGRIYLRRGGDYGKARGVFQRITREYPHSRAANEAKLLLASILLNTGKKDDAIIMLEKVERNQIAPGETRSRAALWRALELERRGKWGEAELVFRRIQRLFPESASALKAPLLIISHNVESQDRIAAKRNLIKARDSYLSIIKKKRVSPDMRLAAENYLVESYLLFGDGREAASLLAREWEGIRWPGNAGALLRSAVLFMREASDRSRAEELLKKCVALYPKTMYARRAGEIYNAMEKD